MRSPAAIAVTGSVVHAGLLVATAVILLGGLGVGTPERFPSADREYTAQQLSDGVCIVEWRARQASYTAVDCATPHDAELVYRPPLVPGLVSKGARYPGELAAEQYVEMACRQAVIGGLYFAIDDYPDDAEQTLQYESPSEAAWDRGDTRGWCWIVGDPGAYTTAYRRALN